MPRRIALSLFDLTGNMVKPWAEAGYECICVDIRHGRSRTEGNITYIGADVMTWLPPRAEYHIAFAFPPCTDLAVSGARWFSEKGLRVRGEAIALVGRAEEICKWTEVPYLIENPVSILSTHWRKPDERFHPYEYGGYLNPPGDGYSKATCLWTGNGFVMPEPRPVPSEGSRMHLLPPSDERADIRSATPPGFAQAVFEANRLRHAA